MTFFEEVMSKESIFHDPSVLSPHYVPKGLPFREKQISEIVSILAPMARGQKPRNLLIYGKTGTGKTSCMKRIMEDFMQTSGFNPNDTIIQYVNCRIYNSRYRVMQRILKEHVPGAEKAGLGLPFFYEKLIEMASSGKQFALVLDEIDMVKDLNEMIYTLSRANDEITRGGVTIVGISNKLSFRDALDPRTKSSLHESEMVFPPYTAEQLQKIISARVNEGFKPNAVESSAVNLAAAITSQESGDARYALKLISKAGEMAERQGRFRLTDGDVEAARRSVELDMMREAVQTLPDMHKMVLESIAILSINGSKYGRLDGMDNGVLFSGEVYEEYDKISKRSGKKARSMRWYKEYVNDLEILGLIATMPSSRGVRGQTTLIKIGSNARDILDILKNQPIGGI